MSPNTIHDSPTLMPRAVCWRGWFAFGPLAVVLFCAALPSAAAADGRAVVLPVTDGDGRDLSDLATQVDEALTTSLSAVPGVTEVTTAPVALEDLQLAAGCSGTDASCLQQVGSAVRAAGLWVRYLRTPSPDSLELTLLYFDMTTEGDPVQVTRRGTSDGAHWLVAAVPGLVERALAGDADDPQSSEEPDPTEASATGISSATVAVGAGTGGGAAEAGPAPGAADSVSSADVTASEATGSNGVGVPAWISLGLGAASIATGVVVGLFAKSTADDYAAYEVNTPADAAGAQALLDQAETQALAANVLFIAGGATLVLGVILATLDLTASPDSEDGVQVGFVPLPGGLAGTISFRGSVL